jgi:hypothetical protein
MDFDLDKVDEFALTLLFFSHFQDNLVTRAWKGIDWDILNRLTTKGYIDDAKNKSKSIVFTEDGITKGKELVEKYFKI